MCSYDEPCVCVRYKHIPGAMMTDPKYWTSPSSGAHCEMGLVVRCSCAHASKNCERSFATVPFLLIDIGSCTAMDACFLVSSHSDGSHSSCSVVCCWGGASERRTGLGWERMQTCCDGLITGSRHVEESMACAQSEKIQVAQVCSW